MNLTNYYVGLGLLVAVSFGVGVLVWLSENEPGVVVVLTGSTLVFGPLVGRAFGWW